MKSFVPPILSGFGEDPDQPRFTVCRTFTTEKPKLGRMRGFLDNGHSCSGGYLASLRSTEISLIVSVSVVEICNRKSSAFNENLYLKGSLTQALYRIYVSCRSITGNGRLLCLVLSGGFRVLRALCKKHYAGPLQRGINKSLQRDSNSNIHKLQYR